MHVRQGVARGLEQRGVLLLVVLHGAVVSMVELVPEIVDPDQNAQHVGLEVDGIRRPALLQIRHLVPADAAIVELETPCGVGREHSRANEQRIPGAERARRIRVGGLAVAAAVGDRVALKENDAALRGRPPGGCLCRQARGRGEGRRRQQELTPVQIANHGPLS